MDAANLPQPNESFEAWRERLATELTTLAGADIANDSGVAGSTVSAALDAAAAAGPVGSVFGRSGAVVAVAGDYDTDTVTNASSVTGGNVSAALDQLDSDLAGKRPAASYHARQNTGSQNLNGTNVAVTWSQVVADQGSDITWDVANPSRFSIATTGCYRITWNLMGTTTSTQRANITSQLRLNGTAMRGPVGASGYLRYASAADTSSVHAAFIYPLTAGDYVEVICNQEAAAGTWNTVSAKCSFSIEFLS